MKPAAICDRPALWTQRNTTVGLEEPLRFITAASSKSEARRSARSREASWFVGAVDPDIYLSMEPVTDHGVEFGQTEFDPLGHVNTLDDDR
jgi:hypothetical protein